MPNITYKHPDGTVTTLDVPQGLTVMRGAVSNNVDGIVAECGGGATCGTCHVYVDPDTTAPLPPQDELENVLLETTASPRQDNSRLSCQLPVTDDLDGLIVHMPEKQV